MKKILCGVITRKGFVPDKTLLGWFERELNCSEQPKLMDGRIAVVSPVCKRFDAVTFISRYEPVIWSDGDGYSKEWSKGCLRVDDDCSVMISSEKIALRSTGSGASMLYFHITGEYIVFAMSMKELKKARLADLDPLGVGEVLRFGAGYGRKTILQGIERLPFGHELEINREGVFGITPFQNFDREPNPSLDESEAKQRIKQALERSLDQIRENSLLLFSGGVDSTLIAQILCNSGKKFKSTMLAFDDDDKELENARRISDALGISFEPIRHEFDYDDLTACVKAYSAPTLDFSILPTYALGREVLRRNQDKEVRLIDGTGGDAWFGFRSLRNADSWRRLSYFGMFRKTAQSIFARMAHHDGSSLLWPLKTLGRSSIRGNAGLGHLCTTPLYPSIIKLSDDEWLSIEDEIVSLYGNLTREREQDAMSQLLVMDACLIATSQFAAKTSQWDLSSDCGTFYPFLTPEVVNIARTLPSGLFFSGAHAKPLLKDLTIEMGLPREFSYRKKSGFQPPLQKMLSSKETLEKVLSLVEEEGEVKGLLTNYACELPRRLLGNRHPLTIQSLYAIWGIIVMTLWVKSLRNEDNA